MPSALTPVLITALYHIPGVKLDVGVNTILFDPLLLTTPVTFVLQFIPCPSQLYSSILLANVVVSISILNLASTKALIHALVAFLYADGLLDSIVQPGESIITGYVSSSAEIFKTLKYTLLLSFELA